MALLVVFVSGSVFAACRACASRGRLAIGLLDGTWPTSGHGASRRWLERIGRSRCGRRLLDEGLVRRCQLAGHPEWPARIVGAKLVAILSGVGVGLAAAWALPPAVALVPIVGGLGYRLPDMVVARIGRHRRRRIDERVTDLVEVLVVTTHAGLSPHLAFRRAAGAMDGPLGEDLRAVVRSIDLGTPWRTALEEIVTRSDSEGLRALVSTLSRSQRLGVSVATGLRGVATELRSERRARTEELARRAPVKMLLSNREVIGVQARSGRSVSAASAIGGRLG